MCHIPGMRRSNICLYLGPADRAELRALTTNRNTPRKLVWRAEIVLATADGHGTFEIMRRAKTSKPTVWRWQQRYLEETRWSITAIRCARAPIAIFWARRCVSCAPHILSNLDRPRFIMTVEAWHRFRQKLTSPAFVISPETSRSRDWLCEDVRPAQGPILFEDLKRAR